MPDGSSSVSIDDLVASIPTQSERLQRARAEIGQHISWYPYDTLGNLIHLTNMLVGEQRDLAQMTGGHPVADIGAADGDLAFLLEDVARWRVDIIDTASTNMNGLQAARALREHLKSEISIH